MLERLVSHAEHHRAVTQLDGDRLVRVYQRIDFLRDDLSGVPGLAVVVAVNRADHRGAVAVAAAAAREPDRNDQPAGLELDAVVRPGGDDLERVAPAQVLERLDNLLGFAPRGALIRAAADEGARVVEAIDEEDFAGLAVDDESLVIEGKLPGFAQVLLDGSGIGHGLESGMRATVAELHRRLPGLAEVGAASEKEVDVGPVAKFSVLARIARDKDRALRGDRDAGDAVAFIAALA